MKEMATTPNEIPSTLKKIAQFFTLGTNLDFARLVQVSREMFDEDYDFQIRDLQTAFPEDFEKDG